MYNSTSKQVPLHAMVKKNTTKTAKYHYECREFSVAPVVLLCENASEQSKYSSSNEVPMHTVV